jgi:hypothetical protein
MTCGVDTVRLVALATLVVSCVAAGCGRNDPCTGVSCSDHGICFSTEGSDALCACLDGYVPVGRDCVANEGCAGVTCDGHGECLEQGGLAESCDCDEGHVPSPDGFHCFPEPTPDGGGE